MTTVDDLEERDMIIRLEDDHVWVWCSCELRVHVIDTQTGQQHMIDEDDVMWFKWSDDGLTDLIASYNAGKLKVEDISESS